MKDATLRGSFCYPDLFVAARDRINWRIKDAGLDEYASSLLGHGLATDSKMPPVVSEVNETIFEENMFVELVVNITVPRIGECGPSQWFL